MKKGSRQSKPQKPQYSTLQNSLFMLKLSWKYKKSVLIFCVLAALLYVAKSMVNLYITPAILVAVENGHAIERLLFTIGLFVASLCICDGGGAYLDSVMYYGRSYVRCQLVKMVAYKAETVSYPHTITDDTTKTAQKVMQNCMNGNGVALGFWRQFTFFVQNTVGSLLFLGVLTTIQPVVALAVVATSVVSYFLGKRLNEWNYRRKDQDAAIHKRVSYATYTFGQMNAAKDVRLFNLLPWSKDLFRAAMNAYITYADEGVRRRFWLAVANLLLTFLRNGVAYVYLIAIVLQKGLPASTFTLYFSAVGGFTSWFGGFLGSIQNLHNASLELSYVREYLDLPELFKMEGGEPLVFDPEGEYEITFRDVSFRYPSASEDTLSHINFTLKTGQKLAIVGVNGAGKTTLMKLLCGFFDPTEGEILLNGKDIRRYNRREYLRLFTGVFQDYYIMPDSIKHNITQGAEADQERIAYVLEMSGLQSKIESLPAGIDTELTREFHEDGIMLSGGETQKLLLARALYREASFMILDEPTAALDPLAEAELYQKYHEMTKGKGAVYSSHRLASTRFCDTIFLLDKNRLAEQGSHEALLAQGGIYARMFATQSQYYREDVVDEA